MKRKLFASKEKLERLYVEEEKSTHEVGSALGVNSKTIWYWLKKYGLSIRSRSDALKGERNYMHDKQHIEEFKRKVSKKLKGGTSSEETRRKLSLIAKQQWSNPLTKKRILEAIRSKAYREKMSEIVKERTGNTEWLEKLSKAQKKLWKDPEERSKRIKATRKASTIRPTIPEQVVIELGHKFNLPFRYVGDGEVVVAGLNPDFISLDNKKIIEIFGRVFHDPSVSFRKVIPWHQQYWGRIARYAQYGYDCLILWDDELENIEETTERIRGFLN